MSLITSLIRRKLQINHKISLARTISSSRDNGGTCIEKILVANRGEIACRVMKTAKRLGVLTVAVYSDADSDALHVRSADEAVRIGPAPARSSYLNSSAIVEAAMKTGAQAVHPGYGFLSESAEFAQICENKGLQFIGPPASAIRDMGDKSASKRIMGTAGVPLVPGYHGDEQDIEFLKLEAEKIGYPVLIKPTHGGGGKGMRIVEKPSEFIDALLSAQREAAASFGINTVLLEKYITQPRHIEVQVFGDKHGDVIHLYERDCSLQRRHQKIIEEAPAPNVTEEFRAHIGQAAVSAAKAVGYYSAGTVEFIVDTNSDQFYFMEMNTRLQVEHPVTEMVVGQDLVEWQIRVANGEPLPLTQDQVSLNGHAFEARIYAENVPKGFLPATGTLHFYKPVNETSTVRVETGVEQGDEVSMHYDPMIAKLVVWGQNRDSALINLKTSLSNFQIAGVPTNISFLQDLASHEAFEKGHVETHFIEHFKGDLLTHSKDRALNAFNAAKMGAMLAAACLSYQEQIASLNSISGGNSLISLWYANPPFRVNHSAKKIIEFEFDKDFDGSFTGMIKLTLAYQSDGGYYIQMEEGDLPGLNVKVLQNGENNFRVDIGGVQTDITLSHYSKDNIKLIHIWHGNHHHQFKQTKIINKLNDSGAHSKSSPNDLNNHFNNDNKKGSVLAPMAGLVVKVLVKNGDQVREGDAVLVLEAMKMEHVVKAPKSGLVEGLKVNTGQQVFDSTVLFNIKGE